MTALTAIQRTEKGKVVRKTGFIPGVIYGKDISSRPVKFSKNHLTRIVKDQGTRAKVHLLLQDEKRQGIIKDVHIDPMTNELCHVDIQLVEKGQKVHWQIPIVFKGREHLESKRLLLDINLDQIEVTGPVDAIPDIIEFDLRTKQFNDAITVGDLDINPDIKVLNPPHTILAVIKA